MIRIFLTLLFGACCLPGYAQPTGIDFRTGNIRIFPDPTDRTIDGEVEYHFEKGPGKDSLWLDAVSMEIGAVLLNNRQVPFGYDGNRIGVEAPRRGGTHALTIRYRAHPKQTVYFLGWDDPVAGNEQIWTQGQGKYSSHWVPSFDDMREKVVFGLTVHFRDGYSAIANGRLAGLTRTDSLKGWAYKMEQPMSSYLLAFAIGRFDSIAQLSASGVPLFLYFPPEAREKVPYTYAHNREIFDFLEREIGRPYPWQVYRQVPVRDFMYAGMENTGATFFDDGYLVDSLGFNDRNYIHVNAHELAHQWFGNLVTETDGGQHWLHEGFATYYAYLAEERIFGPSYLDWKLLQTLGVLEDLDRSGQGASLLDPQAGSLVFYEKGAWALFLLRDQLGDDAFRAGISRYLKDFALANATVDDFLGVMEESGGTSLGDFRRRWLESDTMPAAEARAYLRRRSPLMAAYLDLGTRAVAPDSLDAGVLPAAWEASDNPGYRAALLREYRPSFGEEALKKAFEYPDREVQKALLAHLGPIVSWMIPHLEALLETPSYELREAALFRLWTAAPASQARYLAQAAGNGSMADPKFRQLWWVLALFTDSYAPLEQRATYLEALRETTAPYNAREVRENGFSLLRQIGALDEQNLRDLIGATEHHSWQFRNFTRRLLDEIMEQRPERAYWDSFASDFPEASFPYFYTKLRAL